jgi:hypothetical protein
MRGEDIQHDPQVSKPRHLSASISDTLHADSSYVGRFGRLHRMGALSRAVGAVQ